MGKHKKDKSVKGFRLNPISEGGDDGKGSSTTSTGRSSLGDQLIADRVMDPSMAKLRNKARCNKVEDEPEFVDEKTTHRILKAARRQQKELEDELFDVDDNYDKEESQNIKKDGEKFQLDSKDTLSDESDGEEFALDSRSERDQSDPTEEIDPEDEKALELFMNKDAAPSRTLADLIMERFTEKQTELESQFSDTGVTVHKLDPRVEKMYEGVRDVLCKYRSGKLPKAFKLVPRLTNWEQILHITEPTNWTAAAMYQATRIFTSNLKEKMAQRFFNLVLLPRIRDDIMQYKKLNYHLYQALRKALFKPGAFMKGILIPLCESGNCTLREAVIVGSVLARNSVPILHSSAAMLKIAEMDYSGASSLFLRTFFDKKYALPYRVVDAVVYHFLKFERDKRELPVLWHQSLLVFVQRYKEYLSSEQNEALHQLLLNHKHHKITSEIRRELANSKNREEVLLEEKQNTLAHSMNEIHMQ